MKKSVKAIGVTAALAVMIPLSAYAATAASGTTGVTAGTAAAAQSADAAGKPWKGLHDGKAALGQDVLDLLKLDAATVKAKLAEGKTLAEIASAQGVSRDALKQALTDSFNKRLEKEKQTFAAKLDGMIDTKGGAYPDKKEFGFFKGVMARDLVAASKTLGMTDAELETALKSGKSLADLAKEKNIDVQKLIDAQKAAITKAINQAVKDGMLTQTRADEQLKNAASLAEKIVNDAGFHRHGMGHGDKHDDEGED